MHDNSTIVTAGSKIIADESLAHFFSGSQFYFCNAILKIISSVLSPELTSMHNHVNTTEASWVPQKTTKCEIIMTHQMYRGGGIRERDYRVWNHAFCDKNVGASYVCEHMEI